MIKNLLLALPITVALACGGTLPPEENDAALPTDGVRVDGTTPTSDTGTTPTSDTGTTPTSDAGTTPTPDQGSTTHYDGEPGEYVLTHNGRQYRLYVPSGYRQGTPIPLLLGFHGSGDTGGNFYLIAKSLGWTTAAEPARYALLVPDTKSPYSDFGTWSGDVMNDAGAMKDEMTEILAIVDETARHYNLDTKHLHAFGFSNGGLFVALAGMANSQTFASLTVMAFGWGAQYPLVTPTRKIATQLACGTSDSFYPQAQQSASYLSSQGHPSRLETAAGVSHRFSGICQAVGIDNLVSWMEQHTL
ncbi:MAG: hypothetical protein JRH20_28600 [Deltaproteobacteria bacterium]|nr:hypothetical protein [Deltaproteobacteria bacterium]